MDPKPSTYDLALIARYPTPPLAILISGATGLIGSALAALLGAAGHRVVRLVRGENPAENEIAWNPAAERLDPARLEGFDAVIHLAGENIAGRWTEEKKRRIRDSRIRGTRLLSAALSRLARKPRVLICASATGYYGNRGEEILTEASPFGEGFLARLCRDWEAATEPAAAAGIRVVNLRLGMVLSPKGGALATMLRPFKLGLGGPLGDGRQYVSWIALEDVIGVTVHALLSESLAGPVNAVTPNAVRNREFARTLGDVLGRPALLPAPAFVLRALFNGLADEVLLAGARVLPEKLERTNYTFFLPELENALRTMLGRS